MDIVYMSDRGDIERRIQAIEERLAEADLVRAEKLPVLASLQEDVKELKARIHEILTEINPLVSIKSGLLELPTQMERIKIELANLTPVMHKMDVLREDFVTFKAKMMGAVCVLSITAPIFTGVITAVALKWLHL